MVKNINRYLRSSAEVPLLDQPLVEQVTANGEAEQHAARQAIIAIKHDAQAKKTN